MNDFRRRAKFGLVTSFEEAGKLVRLRFDDVSKENDSDTTAWDYKSHFTEVTFDKDPLESLSLSDAEFARIGENLVIRLLTLSGQSRE